MADKNRPLGRDAQLLQGGMIYLRGWLANSQLFGRNDGVPNMSESTVIEPALLDMYWQGSIGDNAQQVGSFFQGQERLPHAVE